MCLLTSIVYPPALYTSTSSPSLHPLPFIFSKSTTLVDHSAPSLYVLSISVHILLFPPPYVPFPTPLSLDTCLAFDLSLQLLLSRFRSTGRCSSSNGTKFKMTCCQSKMTKTDCDMIQMAVINEALKLCSKKHYCRSDKNNIFYTTLAEYTDG